MLHRELVGRNTVNEKEVQRVPLTIEDIRAMDKSWLLPSEAAQVLGCDPQWLRIMARERPERLGFPVCCTSEHRVKIPREPFLRFFGA